MHKKNTIYVFGNPLLDFDSLPLKLIPDLKKRFPEINFKYLDPNENIKPKNKELVIIDTVMDTEKVEIITDIEKIIASPRISPHDLDLGFNLKLLKKLGLLKKITILGVPPQIKKPAALKQLINLINNL